MGTFLKWGRYILWFFNTKIRSTVTQEVTRVVKHSESNYIQGTVICQSHGRMAIHTIAGQEVRFDHYFRRYREFMSLNFCTLLLCCRYFCLCFLYTGYASPKKRCYMDFMLLGLFYNPPKKLCCVTIMLLCLFHALMLLWFTEYFILL